MEQQVIECSAHTQMKRESQSNDHLYFKCPYPEINSTADTIISLLSTS